jgi:5'-3' exonuclease
MFVDILGGLSSCEDYFFKKVYSAYKGSGIIYKDTPIDQITNNTEVHFLKEDVIRYNQNGYKERYYKYYGIFNVEQACKDYIEGLYWISGYYNTHEHANWSWYYEHHATPFVSDIYHYLKSNTKFISEFICETDSLSPSKPNTTIQQLCMVLPRESLTNVLEGVSSLKVKRIFRTNSDILRKYYPTKITLDMIHREWLWQSKVLFDNFDKKVINLIL